MAIIQRQLSDGELPEPQLIELGEHEELARRHMSRLRFYYQYRGGHIGHQDAVDLDLVRVGAVNYDQSNGSRLGRTIQITTYGVHLLAEETENNRQRRAPHHDLASRLAQHHKTHYLSRLSPYPLGSQWLRVARTSAWW